MSKNDYDDLRRRNIAEKNAALAEFFKDLKAQKNEIKELDSKYRNIENLENEPPRKRRRNNPSASDNDDVNVNNIRLKFRRTYNTRSRSKSSNKNDSNERKPNKPKLQVLFPWAKPFERSLDLMKIGVCDVDQEDQCRSNSDNESYIDDDDDDNDFYTVTKRKSYKITKAPYDPETIPSIDEITEGMLNNIADRSSNKKYCKINGTSCHQCRQKTMDTKTVCRSGECIGIRGQFCGPCLRGRYGESAMEALKDPNWACPPCRGLCNCSICRTRSGLRPTGILAPVAQEEGYTSVMDYLQSAEIDET